MTNQQFQQIREATKKFLHRIKHKFGWNKGRPDSFYDDKGRLMMSFLCECGERSQIFNINERKIDQWIEECNKGSL